MYKTSNSTKEKTFIFFYLEEEVPPWAPAKLSVARARCDYMKLELFELPNGYLLLEWELFQQQNILRTFHFLDTAFSLCFSFKPLPSFLQWEKKNWTNHRNLFCDSMAALLLSHAVQRNMPYFCMIVSHICTHLYKHEVWANVTPLAPLMEVKLVDECIFADWKSSFWPVKKVTFSPLTVWNIVKNLKWWEGGHPICYNALFLPSVMTYLVLCLSLS